MSSVPWMFSVKSERTLKPCMGYLAQSLTDVKEPDSIQFIIHIKSETNRCSALS